jgi:hypothetical protein
MVVAPVTVPGLGYAEAVPGIRASRKATGTARSEVRRTSTLLEWGEVFDMAITDQSFGRDRRIEPLARQWFAHASVAVSGPAPGAA